MHVPGLHVSLSGLPLFMVFSKFLFILSLFSCMKLTCLVLGMNCLFYNYNKNNSDDDDASSLQSAKAYNMRKVCIMIHKVCGG